MTKVGRLFAIDAITKHSLQWYLQEGLIASQDLNTSFDEAVRQLFPHWKVLIDAYDIPDDIMHCPAAQGWVEFNVSNNRGEIINAKL